MKKMTIVGIAVASVVVVAAGAFGISKLIKGAVEPVSVTKVSYLSMGWMDEPSRTSGYTTADAVQEVYLGSENLVNEVYVKVGDKVKIGDKLLAFDTTLLELDLEAQKLGVQALELQLEAAKAELAKLKKTTPVADTDDEARAPVTAMPKNIFSMTAASMPGTGELGGEPEEKDSASPESETGGTDAGGTGESETGESETEKAVESPLSKIKPYKKLKYNAKPYKGTGTKEDPYVFFCVDGVIIESAFMNKLLGFTADGTTKKDGGMRGDGKGSYAILEIREGDSVTGGFVKAINIDGTKKADKPYEPGVTWVFTSEGVTKKVPEVDEPESEDDDDDDDPFDDGFGDDFYTPLELKDAIREKEEDIKDLELDKKEAELELKKTTQSMEDAVKRATINGIVKTVGEPELGEMDGEAFLTVTSNEGIYVKGTISELMLGKVGVGSTMTGTAWEADNALFTAEITEISSYPEETNNAGSWGENANASRYPFLAYIEDPGEIGINQSVELMIESDMAEDDVAIYLEKAYVRTESGQSYVYVADKTNHLVKKFVKTGKVSYGTIIEIKEGLSMEDRIAFPYGKNVKEGTPVKAQDDDAAAQNEMIY